MSYSMRVSTIVRLSDRAIQELRDWREDLFKKQYEDYLSHREWLWAPFRRLVAVLTMTPTGLSYEDFKAQVGGSRFLPDERAQWTRLLSLTWLNEHAQELARDGFGEALMPVDRPDYGYLLTIKESLDV